MVLIFQMKKLVLKKHAMHGQGHTESLKLGVTPRKMVREGEATVLG